MAGLHANMWFVCTMLNKETLVRRGLQGIFLLPILLLNPTPIL